MDDHWIYLNEETSRSYKDNKWFQLLKLIPSSSINTANDTIDRVRFALINEKSLDSKSKKDIYRYVLSTAINDWCPKKESKHMQVFDCPDIFKQTKKIKRTTMLAIQGIVKKVNPDAYKTWDTHFKRIHNNTYKQASRANAKRDKFINSSLYKFIMQLTERDYKLFTADALYQQYMEYCKTHGIVSINKRAVGLELNSHGIESIRHTNGRSYDINAGSIHKFIHYYDDQIGTNTEIPIPEAQVVINTITPISAPLLDSHPVTSNNDTPSAVQGVNNNIAYSSQIDIDNYESDYSDESDGGDECPIDIPIPNTTNSISEYSYDSTQKEEQSSEYDDDESEYDESEMFDKDDPFFKPIDYSSPEHRRIMARNIDDEYIEPQIRLTPEQVLEVQNELIRMRLEAMENESNHINQEDEYNSYEQEYKQNYTNEYDA